MVAKIILRPGEQLSISTARTSDTNPITNPSLAEVGVQAFLSTSYPLYHSYGPLFSLYKNNKVHYMYNLLGSNYIDEVQIYQTWHSLLCNGPQFSADTFSSFAKECGFS